MRKPVHKTSLVNVSKLERDFRRQLAERGLGAQTVAAYMSTVRNFLRFIGAQRLDSVGEDVVRGFFDGITVNKATQAMVIGQFLEFTAASNPLPATIKRGSEAAPVPIVKQQKEVALSGSWAVDKLAAQKEAGDDLIAKLARKLIDHYLYFQGRIQGEPENLDDLYRFADQCKDLIQNNLALFMGLSAQGRNIHSLIDERVQK
jgi:hypothetical protein